MPLGILEDTKLDHVPGTAPLNELELGSEDVGVSGVDPSLLKHDSSGRFVLVPQPSDSPNDPYNWPRWKKEMFTVAFAWGCGCVGAIGPLLGAAFVQLAELFNVELTTFVSGLQGGMIASIAVGSVVFNSLAVKYGKRPIYLATTLGLMASAFWGAEAKSFPSLVASRALAGLCSCMNVAFEQPFSTWAYWVESTLRLQSVTMDGKPTLEHVERAGDKETGATATASASTASSSRPSSTDKPISYARQLLPYSGYVNDVSFWNTLVRPFYLLGSPAVVWATIIFTTDISWLVGISVTLSQIFSAPPYNFSIGAVGATNMSSFVASVIGTLVAGPLIDGVVTRMSKRNNGIFEPEFRLPILLTNLLFTATGFFAWGQSAYALDPWPVPVIVCLGLINLGVQLATTGVVAYVVDCHREKAGEAFATMNCLKNLFAFGLTFYMNGWLASQGVRKTFFTIGGITVAVTLLTVPMYIYGKRSRSWVHRHNITNRI
ncbi:hypothetical protein T310_7033 [Rasamsonia emersonii CBS 393.64]|uniref:Major facilitator superfamily (MFS) profile domain-containing protein n=1 Tax=Rasamsonia emersonii (strain ATCC 16479 / CBS 393.64 / IMI 116815) TaxID=1408163 RepID=A0A0F4YLK8_RASE3|nr:hypothetical protein T310_7033 [Rasamsonia emersonii CBS 393.64]KKA19005.1 hypothetical protein T310_7033 [Rasamsonia emersonii CBS 393.64]